MWKMNNANETGNEIHKVSIFITCHKAEGVYTGNISHKECFMIADDPS